MLPRRRHRSVFCRESLVIVVAALLMVATATVQEDIKVVQPEKEECANDQCAAKTGVDLLEKVDLLQVIERTEQYGPRQAFEAGQDYEEETKRRLAEVDQYMRDVVFSEKTYESVADRCRNAEDLCVFWAAVGECETNPDYMQIHCAPACFTCDKLSFELRCPFDETHIWQPGDVHAMFERVTADPNYQAMNLTILSRPGWEDNRYTAATGQDAAWIITLDGFLTDEECDTLIRLGAEQGYERSEDADDNPQMDGTFGGKKSDGRTSTNAWCVDACYNHSVTQRVIEKIENLTGVPDINSEYLQLLRYEPGQFYERHHDYIPRDKKRPVGVRMLTVFLYLNDVEEGGATYFNDLDITVPPKKGRALIWPSVINDDPNEQENSTNHEALAVVKGEKYGANAWLHQRDFKTPHRLNCL